MSIFKDFVQENAASKKKTPEEWLLDVAKVAKNCSLATHTSKYATPDGDVTVLWEAKRNEDPRKPYVSTGSVNCAIDVIGGAAATPAAKTAMLKLEDGIIVLEHLKKDDSQELRDAVEGFGVDYPIWRDSMLDIKPCEKPTATCKTLSQVFFPTDDSGDYHILSVLPAGCVMQEVRSRLIEANKRGEPSDETQPKQEKRYIRRVLTTHGGGNPVNISLNNNSVAGKMYMIEALPPVVRNTKKASYPKKDFFQTLRLKPYAKFFFKIHAKYKDSRNNKEIRVATRDIEKDIMERMLLTVFALRGEPAGWSDKSSLPPEQCIWLDDKYAEVRDENTDWIKPLAKSFADWFMDTYEFLLRGDKVELGEGEREALYCEVRDFIKEEIRN